MSPGAHWAHRQLRCGVGNILFPTVAHPTPKTLHRYRTCHARFRSQTDEENYYSRLTV